MTIKCSNFTHDLNNLPYGLEILEIGDGFVGTLKIPTSTKILYFKDFNRSIENLLNDGLEELYISGNFNQPLNNGEKSFLPSTLKKLSIKSSNFSASNFNQNLHFLPDGLENIELDLIEDYSFDINSLPSNLKVLDICRQSYKNIKILTIKVLPENIEVLKLNINSGCCIPQIPNSCKTLSCYLSKEYGPFVLPTNIEYLELHKVDTDQLDLEKDNIPTIDQLLDYNHDKHVQNVLNTVENNNQKFLNLIKGFIFPSTLKNLEIPDLDCRKVTLPYGLKNLIINDYSSRSYLINLPDSIEYIKTCHLEFIDKLPNSLKKLSTNYFNKNLIENLAGSSNSNIQIEYFGKLERQYAYASAFSFT